MQAPQEPKTPEKHELYRHIKGLVDVKNAAQAFESTMPIPVQEALKSHPYVLMPGADDGLLRVISNCVQFIQPGVDLQSVRLGVHGHETKPGMSVFFMLIGPQKRVVTVFTQKEAEAWERAMSDALDKIYPLRRKTRIILPGA